MNHVFQSLRDHPSRFFAFVLSFVFLFASPVTSAQETVRVSEVMYHPVERPIFDSQGLPVLDLSEDVYEFVELHNTAATSVSLKGWQLSGGVKFDFPSTAIIPANGYLVVAKSPDRIAAVTQYQLARTNVLGPFSGKLSNKSDTVQVLNPTGQAVDSVSYSASFPWPISADALGAGDEWTGLISLNHQYRGRSLERISFSWNGNDPANWVASPLPGGPTPGRSNSVQLDAPKPIVIRVAAVQEADGATLIRSNNAVQIQVVFSHTAQLSSPAIEYYIEDIAVTNETRLTVPLVVAGPASYTASLPGQTNRAIVRYRIVGDREGGVEPISPRPDEPFPWHAYFVTPVRTSVNPIYEVFISTTSLNRLASNISQSPRRVTLPDPPGAPRKSWNATEPAIFVSSGKVYDIRMRYHGSRYNRSSARKSYKYEFPRYAPFNGRTSFFETDKGEEHRLGAMLYDAANLPAWRCRYVDIYQNRDAVLRRLEQEEAEEDLFDRWIEEQALKFPDEPPRAMGDMYKAEGVVPYETASGQGGTSNYDLSGEGPYFIANEAPIPAKAGWTLPERYDWTFPNQTQGWKGGNDLYQMVKGMWAARGDKPTVPRANVSALRTFLAANFDVDSTLTYIAIRNWSSPFDNATHNHFVWHEPTRGWSMMAWDLDGEFSDSGKSIFWDEQTVPQPDTLRGPDWIKDSFFKTFRNEYRQKMFILNNTLLSPDNLTRMGANGIVSYARARQTSVNNQLGLGPWYAPQTPTNAAPLSGASVFPGAPFQTKPYGHSDPAKPVHASTTWMLRSAAGNYAAPILRRTSTTNLTAFPIPFERLAWGQQYFWKCYFTDANGHPSPESAETSFIFGGGTGSSAGINGIFINEVLADNRTVQNGAGEFPDFIELVNTTDQPQDLTGASLTDNVLNPGKFFFPPGTKIGARDFLTIWCDSANSSPGLHSGFALDKDGQTVALFVAQTNGYSLADAVTFGMQLPDRSVGRIGTGWVLNTPSPGAINLAAALGAPDQIKINEWMASDSSGSDWFELFNSSGLPVNLASLLVTNNSSGLSTRLPELTFIGSAGFRMLIADRDLKAGARHVAFRLSASGDTILLLSTNSTVIDTVTFGSQVSDVSQGRLLDGGTNIVSFPQTASPEGPNYLALPGVIINEVLSHSEPPLEDSMELFNGAGTLLIVAGWWLSDDADNLQKFQIPANTAPIASGGYLVFTESQFNRTNSPTAFALNSTEGDELYLSEATVVGVLTGRRTSVKFGPAANGVSFGQVKTSAGMDFWAQKQTSFGAVNAGPLVGPVVISEVQYHPPTVPGDDEDFEYIRLENITDAVVPLFDGTIVSNTWYLRDAVSFLFPTNIILAPRSSVIVVGFDPSDPSTQLDDFRTLYGIGEQTRILGPYEGKLSNSGDSIELVRRDAPQTNSFGQKVVANILVDRVNYQSIAPWPTGVDGTGLSIHRTPVTAYGNEPANWFAGASAVKNAKPEIVFLSPTNAAKLRPTENINLIARATDTDGTVKQVDFYLDGDRLGTAKGIGPDYSLVWTNATIGTHELSARAVDNLLGLAETEKVFVDVINAAPVVSLLSPTNGASFPLPASILLEANASDTDGKIVQLDFYATGILIASLTMPPYRYLWTNAPSGIHQITAAATDDAGTVTITDSVQIRAARDVNIAYVVNAGTVGAQAYANGLGMDFNVVTNIVVSRLGVFDSGGDGIKGNSTLTVQIFSRSGNAGVVRATTTFSLSDPGELIAGSRFKPLAAPVTLTVGSYTIVGFGFDASNMNGNTGVSNPATPWLTDDGGGLLNFVGTSRYGSGGPGTFPATPDGGPVNRYAAGTFEYSRVLTRPPALTTSAQDSGIRLSWGSVPSASAYKIKRSPTSGGPYILMGTTNLTSFIDSNVDGGVTYYYVVSAFNAAVESVNSIEVPGTAKLSVRVAVEVTAGKKDITVSWPQALVGYNLYQATNLFPPVKWTVVTNPISSGNGLSILNLSATNGPHLFFELGSP